MTRQTQANPVQVRNLGGVMAEKFEIMKDKAGFNEPEDTRDEDLSQQIYQQLRPKSHQSFVDLLKKKKLVKKEYQRKLSRFDRSRESHSNKRQSERTLSHRNATPTLKSNMKAQTEQRIESRR